MRRHTDEADALRPPLFHRATPGQLQLVDFALAFVLLSAAVPRAFNGGAQRHGPAVLVLAFGAAVPIALRRVAPMLALAIATISLTIATALGQTFAPDPLIAIPIYQVASVRARRESVPALVLAAVALLVGAGIGAASNPGEGEATFAVLLSLAGWFVGDSVRVRREYRAGLVEQAAQRQREEVERGQRSVAEERLRIARELHDVVAHSLSVIAVQSGVGRHVIDSRPEEAKKALAAVEATSRSALDDLRHMLGVLRRDEQAPASLTPTPGIAALDQLVEQVRATGIQVQLVRSGEALSSLAPTLDLCVYRIVQEALTNVVKHAGEARVVVELRQDGEQLLVSVTDNGAGALGPAVALGDASEHHGLIGMRERVALFGGIFEAGPGVDGGWVVTARLPLIRSAA